MTTIEDLTRRLEESHSLPFLFIGSGFSRRYLKTETWSDLLRRFADETGHPYDYYRSSANSYLPRVATEIASEFHNVWWKSSKYKKFHSDLGSDDLFFDSPLKYEISKYLKNQKVPNDLESDLQSELSLFRKIQADGILTTNWDCLIEELLPDFRVFVGQEELLFSNPQGVAEIYKIHGSCTQPNSLVLTDSDYNDFKDRNPYLAAKLLSIFIEHPVVFLGYSVTDPNIQEILSSLTSCMPERHISKLQDNLIFVEWSASLPSLRVSRTLMHIDRKPLPITLVQTRSFLPLFAALSKPKRKFPARILRQLKEQVYNLILTNDPDERLYVTDLAQASDNEKFDVVYGVGLISKIGEKGYAAISSDDIYLDVLKEDRRYDAQMVVKHTLPLLLKRTPNIPVFTYLRKAGYLPPEGELPETIDERVQKAAHASHEKFWPTNDYYLKQKTEIRKLGSIDAILETFEKRKATYLIPLLEPSSIDLNSLRAFILDNRRLLTEQNTVQTNMRKLVCVYDYLKYGQISAGTPQSTQSAVAV